MHATSNARPDATLGDWPGATLGEWPDATPDAFGKNPGLNFGTALLGLSGVVT